jgi:hypothetical protein
VLNFYLIADMGRMKGRWPWAQGRTRRQVSEGGNRAAAFLSLIGTTMLNGLDPEAYLRHILAASLILRSTVSINYCHGMSKLLRKWSDWPLIMNLWVGAAFCAV